MNDWLLRYETPPSDLVQFGQRSLARTLQWLIQPPAGIHDMHGLRVTVRCVSADLGAGVGGDWYLALAFPDGDVVLAVGDVCGHGLAAALAMTRLRFATAAYAAEGVPPAAVLDRLNSLVCSQGVNMMVSAVVARYRSRDGELTWACAGHPPMLLAHDGRVTVLPSPAGPLLGMSTSAAFGQSTLYLHPDEAIICYTDGMVGRGLIDDELAILAAQIRAVQAQPDLRRETGHRWPQHLGQLGARGHTQLGKDVI